MKRYVIGDIHGRYDALKEVLFLSKFDYENDKLIILGDIADGDIYTKECVEELLKIKNLVFVLGNHDHWFIKHFTEGFDSDIWLSQGGKETIQSYGGKDFYVPVLHQIFFSKAVPYYIEDNMIFVHGGFNPKVSIDKQKMEFLIWDRNLINTAKKMNIQNKSLSIYKKIFIGHTSTQYIDNSLNPLKIGSLYCLDTGAGWNGKLTIMDIDTEEYWQSKQQIIVGRKADFK